MDDQLVVLEETAPKAVETTVLGSEETAKVESQDDAQLSPEERTLLQETEKVIEIGLGQFLAVGQALSKIKASKLYRETGTFEEYCQARWNLGSSYAYRLIESAECVTRLQEAAKTKGYSVFPANESVVRPLTRLEPKRQVTAWKNAVKKAKGNNVTAEIVEKVVSGKLPKSSKKQAAKSTKKGADRPLKSIAKLVSKELEKSKALTPRLKKLLERILGLTGVSEKSSK